MKMLAGGFLAVALLPLALAAAERKVVFSAGHSYGVHTAYDERFEEFAKLAKELGATHVAASSVSPAVWMWNQDRRDPYLNWMIANAGVFRFILPEPLKPYLDADYVAGNRARLERRGQVLKALGLKAAFFGSEPQVLPEKAYRDHPRWRGPRCDCPYRSRHEYYAPCTDNPEIRKMYVEATAELCRIVPFESFDLLTNDSGTGLCWWRWQYPGANGPSECRDKSFSARVIDFMSLFQDGAAQAGLKASVNICNFMDIDQHLPNLKEGQSVRGCTLHSKSVRYDVCGQFFPLTHPPLFARFAETFQIAQQHPEADMAVHLVDADDVDAVLLLRKHMAKPLANGPAARYAAMTEVAADLVGPADAADLVRAWELADRIVRSYEHYDYGGPIFMLGTVHQRWLTRPLVAFPSELTDEEKGYYRPFQFQARGEKQAEDLLNLQDHRFLSGYAGYQLYDATWRETEGYFAEAMPLFGRLVAKARDAAAEKYLSRALLSMKALRAVTRNGRNVIKWQFLLDDLKGDQAGDETDEIDHRKTEINRCQGDCRFQYLQDIRRDEIDNTLALIDVLDEAARRGFRLLASVEKPEDEIIMAFAPDIRPHLRRKVEIMENHRRDIRRLAGELNH